jgi:hypothetical protein
MSEAGFSAMLYLTLLFPLICSSKKGVQIFNVLGIISVVIMMVLLSVNKYADVEVDVNGDPTAEQEMKELKQNYMYYMIAYGVGLAVYIIALMGACMYSSCLVSIAILYALFNLGNMIYFGVTEAKDEEYWIFGYIVWPVFWSLIYIYPHAVFISEVNKGIMSPKTYARERASLCCV